MGAQPVAPVRPVSLAQSDRGARRLAFRSGREAAAREGPVALPVRPRRRGASHGGDDHADALSRAAGVVLGSPDFYAQVAALAAADRIVGPAIQQGLRERDFSRLALRARKEGGEGFTDLATAAGEMLARPDGPRVAALELDGWDTHAAQPARLAAVLCQLDAGLAALREALGPVWRDSAILCMTEFGPTVRVNGTRGTGSVALLLGGGVADGQVRADWPASGRAGCSRTATSHQPPICAPSPRAC